PDRHTYLSRRQNTAYTRPTVSVFSEDEGNTGPLVSRTCFTDFPMKTIITAAQTREADRYTIETVPIASIDLMENASIAFVAVFMQLFPDKNTQVLICCGTGNNGGDGLA